MRQHALETKMGAEMISISLSMLALAICFAMMPLAIATTKHETVARKQSFSFE